jgi:hypothetical protein
LIYKEIKRNYALWHGHCLVWHFDPSYYEPKPIRVFDGRKECRRPIGKENKSFKNFHECFLRHLTSFRASERNDLETRLTIREALAFRALERARRTFPILATELGAVVVTELKFREIAV